MDTKRRAHNCHTKFQAHCFLSSGCFNSVSRASSTLRIRKGSKSSELEDFHKLPTDSCRVWDQVVFGHGVSRGSVQFSSVAQSCPTLYDAMNCSLPGLPVHHQLPEFTQTHVHRVGDTIQPSHPLSSPSPPAPNPSQHQSFIQ